MLDALLALVLRIINEPTAASLAYGFDKSNETILVFDLAVVRLTFRVEVGDGVLKRHLW